MSLVHEIKRRRSKQAMADAAADFGLRTAVELGEEAAERGVIRKEQEGTAPLPALHVRPVVESRVSDLVTGMVKNRQILPREAKKTSKAILEQLEPEIQKQEAVAFRAQAGESVQAPATMMGTAGALGIATAFPWLITRGSWLWGKKPENPYTLGQSFKFNFLPNVIPFAAGIEGVGHLLAPMSDPLRQQGRRGYWKSVRESFRGAQEGLAERGAEARERYGVAGIPLQMLHGVFNPLASLAYLGRQVGGVFQKPDIETWAQEAAARRRAMYGQS